MLRNLNVDKVYQFLLITLAFLLPLTVFGANLVIVLICILWLVSGDYKSKFIQIINNKLMIASILFYVIHIFGLIWTEDMVWGLHIAHKMWYFIGLLPILFTIVKKNHIKYYVSSFLIAISITEVTSYLIWFELIEPFDGVTAKNPTPFMSSVSYNPILAFATYIVLHELFLNKSIKSLSFLYYIILAFSMSVNMFITGGRAGQVGFFVMIGIIIFQFFDKQKIKSLLVILIVIPVIFSIAFLASDIFQQRFYLAINETINYSENVRSSVGARINFTINSLYIIFENPIIGVGTGDFPIEYAKVNAINSPELYGVTNPHNMYILVATQLGVVGLLSMLSIFYFQLKLSSNSSNKFLQDTGFALPIMFLVMMISESYLLGHFTSLMFVFFSSFLYKDFEKY
jgi:O-antigen ligase